MESWLRKPVEPNHFKEGRVFHRNVLYQHKSTALTVNEVIFRVCKTKGLTLYCKSAKATSRKHRVHVIQCSLLNNLFNIIYFLHCWSFFRISKFPHQTWLRITHSATMSLDIVKRGKRTHVTLSPSLKMFFGLVSPSSLPFSYQPSLAEISRQHFCLILKLELVAKWCMSPQLQRYKLEKQRMLCR